MERIILFTLGLFFCLFSFSQNFQLSGKVVDTQTDEAVPFVSIKDLTSGKSTISDIDGNYTLSLEKGLHQIELKFFGYKTAVQEVDLQETTTLDLTITPEGVLLDQVEIVGEKADENINSVEMSTNELDIEEIKKLPAFLGEVDVIKTIQLLPGVSTVGEGATGFNVRGGNIDQNLVLWDGSTIYSSSHLFGFFSIFNSDAVSDLKLYKGGIPARYGGRLSSVLDVSQRKGNNERLEGSGGIGVVSSRLMLNGPIKKDKSTFIVSGRRSYADLFLNFSADTVLQETVAYFGDLNGRVDYKLGESDQLSVSGYYGNDVFSFGGDFGFVFGNRNVVSNWQHSFSDSTFLNTSLAFNAYKYTFDFAGFFEWTSLIQNYALKSDLQKIISPKHTLRYGGELNYYRFNPAEVEFSEEFDDVFNLNQERENGMESAVYISDEYKHNDRLSIQYGLRYSQFALIGPITSFGYEENLPLDPSTITDTTNYETGDLIKFYHGLEPRLGIKYSLDSTSSVKISYMRTRQNLHLVSNTTNGLPIDVWKMSDEFVTPAIADQVGFGYFRNFLENRIEFSAEVYYKDIRNILDYKNGADLLLNPTLETELLQGKGRAYGLEILLRKNKGKLNGWIAYTLSRTERKVDGDFSEEKINNGDWYRSDYDKPHDLTLVGSYQINKRMSFGANFTYSTGRPITLPDSRYVIDGIQLANYLLRNQGRIPNYHRLDLSFTIDGKNKNNRRWEGSWAFSIYNVYGRRNPYSISFQENEETNELETVQLSILGTVLPAVTYNFQF